MRSRAAVALLTRIRLENPTLWREIEKYGGKGMFKWWYYTIYRCPDCGKTREEYDATAPNYDSGLSSSPVIDEFCDECFDQRVQEDEERENHDHGSN